MTGRNLPSNLYSVLQSFVTLAQTLNLSKTTERLDITRQSVRRHIDWLEQKTDAQLFTYEHNQYGLTPAGEQWLTEAANLLDQADLVFGASSSMINGLPLVHVEIAEDHHFYAQQHPIVDVWKDDTPPLIKRGLEAWVTGHGAIDHDALKTVRPYLVAYRHLNDQWICTEVGELSSYASWLVSTWARSYIGRAFGADPIQSPADQFMLRAHRTAERNGAPWYDHICTRYTRGDSDELLPVNYQKLVLPCRFPDNSPVMAILVARTNNISIFGLEPSQIAPMPAEDLMDFDI